MAGPNGGKDHGVISAYYTDILLYKSGTLLYPWKVDMKFYYPFDMLLYAYFDYTSDLNGTVIAPSENESRMVLYGETDPTGVDKEYLDTLGNWNTGKYKDNGILGIMHSMGKKVLASFGGHKFCMKFPQLFDNKVSRDKFAQNVADVVNKYGFDGCDISWIFPGRYWINNYINDIRGDTHAPTANDAENLVELMKSIRSLLPSKIITLFTSPNPSNSSYNFDELTKYVDQFNIGTYCIKDTFTLGYNGYDIFKDNLTYDPNHITYDDIVDHFNKDLKIPLNKINIGTALVDIDRSNHNNEGTGVIGDPADITSSTNALVSRVLSITQSVYKAPVVENTFFVDNPQIMFLKGKYIESKGINGGLLWDFASCFDPDNIDSVSAFMMGYQSGIGMYDIHVKDGGLECTILPGSKRVEEGSNITYTITPKYGYLLRDVIVNGVSQGPIEVWTFHNVREDNTITSVCIPDNSITFHKIYTKASDGGVYSLIDPIVPYGDSVGIRISPKYGWVIRAVVVDGEPQQLISGGIEFNNVTTDHTIYLDVIEDVRIKTFKITTKADTGVNFDVVDPEIIYGGNTRIQIIPQNGYLVDKVIVDGNIVVLTLGNFYLDFSNITDHHEVYVDTKEDPTVKYFTVRTIGENGIKFSNNNPILKHGSNIDISVDADIGYLVKSIFINDTNRVISGKNTVTITNITKNIDIIVSSMEDVSIKNFMIDTEAEDGIVFSEDDPMVHYGSSKTISVTPQNGYLIDKVYIDNVEDPTFSGSYTFSNVTNERSIFISTKEDPTVKYFKIGTKTEIGATFSVVNPVVKHGSDQDIYILPDYGYVIDGVSIDGTIVSNFVGVISLKNITDHHEIVVWTKPDDRILKFTVTTNADTGVTFDKNNPQVDYGKDITIQLIPQNGYLIKDVILDGRTIAVINNTITITGIVSDRTLVVRTIVDVSIQYHTVHTSSETGVTLSLNNPSVKHGNSVSINVNPTVGYLVKNVYVDGEPIPGFSQNGGVVNVNNVTVDRSVVVSTIADISIIQYNIITTTMPGATFDVINPVVTRGGNKRINITPQNGYVIDRVILNGNNVSSFVGYVDVDNIVFDNYIYVVTKPDVTITYNTVNTYGDTNVTFDINNPSVKYGGGIDIKFTIAYGFKVLDVVLDGVKTTNYTNNTINLTNITAPRSVVISTAVDFSVKSFTVRTQSELGAVFGVSNPVIPYGGSVDITASLLTGYLIDKVYLDDDDVTGSFIGNKLSITNITRDRYVYISTKQDLSITYCDIFTYGDNVVFSTKNPRIPYNTGVTINIDACVGWCIMGVRINGVMDTAYTGANNKHHSIILNNVINTQSIEIVAAPDNGGYPVWSTYVTYSKDQKVAYKGAVYQARNLSTGAEPTASGAFGDWIKTSLIDTTPPRLVLLGQNPMTMWYKTTYTEPGYVSIDNTDGDITGNVAIVGGVLTETPGTYVITYTSTDALNNSSTVDRVINVLRGPDNTPPVLTLFGLKSTLIGLNKPFTEPGFSAMDNIDGNITANVTTATNLNTSVAGVYTKTYTIKDAGGNMVQTTRTIQVTSGASICTGFSAWTTRTLWSSSTNYNTGSTVFYNGSVWTSKYANNQGTAPVSGSAWWTETLKYETGITKVTDGTRLWVCKNPTYANNKPSGATGADGWDLLGTC